MGLLIVDNQFLPEAIALVKQAKKEICLSSFKLEISDKPRGKDLNEFFDEVIAKLRQGVKVRILFNWHDDRRSVPKTNEGAAHFLKNGGADVRYLKNNRCCHAKLLLIDKEKVLLGSHNLSIRSTQANFEMSYLIPDPETVAQVSAVFEAVFNDAKKI
jgi:phosphatidylserine/phosphatidylglycerophosphate/cardiolipin synthase-like enzyme